MRDPKTGRYLVKHGMEQSRVYITWAAMLQRCSNPNAPDYDRYGGRGIGVDPSWLEFQRFYADVGDRPEGKSLDRPKVNESYGPSNWRWATPTEQQRNKRNNRKLRLNHVEMSLCEWAEMIGIGRATIARRVDKLGWSVRDALTTPLQK